MTVTSGPARQTGSSKVYSVNPQGKKVIRADRNYNKVTGRQQVIVNGKRVPLVGRVSMDMITLDISSQPQAQPGDPVVLWGKGLPADEIAASAGTISYELYCHVAKRIPRVTANGSYT